MWYPYDITSMGVSGCFGEKKDNWNWEEKNNGGKAHVYRPNDYAYSRLICELTLLNSSSVIHESNYTVLQTN